jgi:Ca2+-binding EF-hand superfamily protein
VQLPHINSSLHLQCIRPDALCHTQAFRTLDEAGSGFVDAGLIKDLLMSQGTPLKEKEVEAFMGAARDAADGNVYYEDYIATMHAMPHA